MGAYWGIVNVNQTSSPLLRVMALHALGYCERLFYLEEVEEIRVADHRVYAGRELHAGLEAEEEGEWASLELEGSRLGLKGKVDALRRRGGEWIPYEHKRGRAWRDENNKPGPWQSDRWQVLAYALLLEDAFNVPVPEARIRYHSDNVTVRISIDEFARRELRRAIERAVQLSRSLERPPIAENERLCQRCSLAPVCLPEEVRQQMEPERDPTRLFPPDRDGTTLHVLTPGTAVGRSGDCLVVKPREGPPSKHPVRQLESVLLHGFAQISTQAIHFCVHHGVSISWLSTSGRHIAGLTSTTGQVQRRLRQYHALGDEATSLRLAKILVNAKIAGQIAYLRRLSRKASAERQKIAGNLRLMQNALSATHHASDKDRLRGQEGMAANAYFASLRELMSDSIPESLRFENRNRRPPIDRFNAILSFGYGLLHTAVTRGVLASGLEPSFGFFHTPRSSAHPLVLDLMELFRTTLWDLPLLGSLHRGQWDPEFDFTVTPTKVWLSDSGRSKAIGLFESRLEETWKHPVLKYSLSYARTIELEARLLEKEWTGEPGLFARSRLR